jgi:hypothetical protein
MPQKTRKLLDASTKAGTEANHDELECTLIPICGNTNQNRSMKITCGYFENVTKFTCLGKTQRNGNYINTNIKSKSNSGKAGYNSV